MNYYNEFDPKAAAWLRELIATGCIPNGHVDERSIVDVQPSDLAGYTQCHFFAGVGGWSEALRLAGWPEDKPVWTGSCPCQPFSCAGKGKGTDDERHLWPEFMRLIRACRPPVVFGEQVASAAVVGSAGKRAAKTTGPVWLDGIRADLEAARFTLGAVDLAAAGINAPHIRQRLFWVAHTQCDGGRPDEQGRGPEERTSDRWAGGMADSGRQRDERRGVSGVMEGPGGNAEGEDLDQARRDHALRERQRSGDADSDRSTTGRMAHVQQQGLEGHAGDGDHGDEPGRIGTDPAGPTASGSGAGGMGEPDCRGRSQLPEQHSDPLQNSPDWNPCGEHPHRSGVAHGHWSNFTIIPCRDGKARRTEPSIFPLVNGASSSVVPGSDPGVEEAQASAEDRTTRLRGYGNAIVAPLAAEFIVAFSKIVNGRRSAFELH